MAKALADTSQTQKRAEQAEHSGTTWHRKASDHIAYGLLVYTGMHIFWTMTQLKSSGGSVLPYFALVVLVIAIIPGCRYLERRWEQLTASGVDDATLAPMFRKEMGLFWLCVIGLPIGLTLLFKGVAALL
ncbi:hypothetical protein [Aurantiacibacter sp. MUD61]|uniref:hypothetical protein n=1 Tax=Aurantiacibacter sp. MUD61 TaxID=3009083 RepID=UPI0022F0BBA8|nr:hypothetical protein [Aurantiacibacter sp. MUD61]